MADNNIDKMRPGANNSNNDDNAQVLAYLKAIADSLASIQKTAGKQSQSAAKDKLPTRQDFQDKRKKAEENRKTYKSTGRPFEDFTDSFEGALLEGFLGSDFKDRVRGIFSGIADELGVSIKDIPGALGQEIGRQAMSAFKNTDLGKSISSKVDAAKDKMFDKANSAVRDIFGGSKSKATDANSAKKAASEAASNAGDEAAKAATNAAAKGAKQAGEAAAKEAGKQAAANVGKEALSTAASSVVPGGGIVADAAASSAAEAGVSQAVAAGATSSGTVAASGGAATAGAASSMSALASAAATAAPVILAIVVVLKLLEPMLEGLATLGQALIKTGNREKDSRKERLKNSEERLRKDINAMIEQPFKILENAAQKIYDTWDANLRTITATQGYSKADLQSLMGNYADRLRKEGFSDTIATTDITESLAKVLQSGLSGKVAEEFAYQATKLGAAVPTEDFFGYADVYASIAANAIAAGKSESEAIAAANAQLNQFASNLLYAGRQLSGGFSTGLKDAQGLFKDAVQIAQTARIGDSSQISGVLTSVSAIVGAVAPDLASALVDNVVKAATGGNSDQIVALRSLAGINASNTEFLRAFANDPQQVFTSLFRNLSNIQSSSADNYMEVAEGLSSVFGVSMEALSRVDFNYLADAISAMEVNQSALSENLANLRSGETTSTPEQLKIAQINKYMLEEGLAYVLDNDVARAVQQHMWDEQLANEMQEATYGVEIQGAALKLIEGIAQATQNIIDFLNPIGWLKRKVGNILDSAADAAYQNHDLKAMLQLTKVGSGRSIDFANLTTRGQMLKLTSSYVDLLGGKASYDSSNKLSQRYLPDSKLAKLLLGNPTIGYDVYDTSRKTINQLLGVLRDDYSTRSNGKPTSGYRWGMVGKSTALPSIRNSETLFDAVTAATSAAVSGAETAAAGLIKKVLSTDYLSQYTESGYDAWLESTKALGIADIDTALEAVGKTSTDIKSYFNTLQAQAAAKNETERKTKEETYWDNTSSALSIIQVEQIPAIITGQDNMLAVVTSNFNQISGLIPQVDETLQSILESMTSGFYTIESKLSDLINEYANSVAESIYSDSYSGADVDRIDAEERNASQDTLNSLVDAMTLSSEDGTSMDQTNALLVQMLALVATISRNSESTTAGTMLPDSLSGLARGLIR